MGRERPIARIQLIIPIKRPSMMTMRKTAALDAPKARITPISRVRSMTFRLIVPISPRPPTVASTTVMTISRATMMAKARVDFLALLGDQEVGEHFDVGAVVLLFDGAGDLTLGRRYRVGVRVRMMALARLGSRTWRA